MDFNYIKEKMPWIARVIFLLFIGSFLMILSNSLGQEEKNTDEKAVPQIIPSSDTLSSMQQGIETRLQATLTEIEGVGEVTVTVFLASGPKFNYAINNSTNERTIEENDKSGVTRVTSEHTTDDQLVFQKEGNLSTEKPVLLSEEQAKVQGVLVVADGASSSYLKREITLLVATLLDIPEYKVTVEPRKGGMYVGSDER